MVKNNDFSSLEGRNKYIVLMIGETFEKVADDTGLSTRQVRRVYKAYKEDGRIGRKSGSGRPKALRRCHKTKILDALRKNAYLSLRDLRALINYPACPATMETYLRNLGWNYKKSKTRPALSSQDKQK